MDKLLLRFRKLNKVYYNQTKQSLPKLRQNEAP